MSCNSKCKIQNADECWLRRAAVLTFCILHSELRRRQLKPRSAARSPRSSSRKKAGPSPIRSITALIETHVGSPLDAKEVRETIAHLMSLNRFDDVQVLAEDAGAGIRVRYVLTPLHPVDRIEFEGMLGLPEDALLRVVVDRFGNSPRAARAPEIVEALRAEYRRRGYANARIESRLVETHNPDRATLVFEIESGRRLTIADMRFTQRRRRRPGHADGACRTSSPASRSTTTRSSASCEPGRTRCTRAGSTRRAPATEAEITDDGAIVSVNLTRGPRVVVRFTGDPLPEDERERLVPIRTEGSADEDLLEDSSRAIEDVPLHARLPGRGRASTRARSRTASWSSPST